MKKTLLLCLTLSISLWAHAQATDLVVDCQTPGWLSSKINYGDQQTVKNLKVTGYINNADLEFIGSLISSRSLNGELDLSECNIVGVTADKDNVLGGLGASGILNVYRIPKSATEVNYCTGSLYVENLYFDCNLSIISVRCLGGENTHVDNLYIGNNIEEIEGQNLINSQAGRGFTFIEGIKSVYLSKKIKRIGDCAFYGSGIENVNFNELEELECLGSHAFRNSKISLDTIVVPAKLKEFNASSFSYHGGQHIYIGKNVESIATGADLKFTYGFGDDLIFHMESATPPSGHRPNSTCTVYVPKGAKPAYVNAGWANIIELNPVESVTLNEHSITLNKTEQFNLSVSILPEDADDKTINWTSEDTSVATVDENGVVTAIKEGQTEIVVTSTATGLQDRCTVLVRKNVTNIALEESQITISNIGESKQLTAIITPEDATEQSVTWKSSNEAICTVTNQGLVTATGIGSTLVTATTVDGGLTATCIVKVIQHVEKVSLNKVALELKVNESEQLIANVSPDNADNKTLTWSSSNNQVATVDANGNVQALKAGEACIKAVSVDNAEAKDSCKVTVIQPVTGVNLSMDDYTFDYTGESIQLVATVLPEDASNKEVRWSSSNDNVCIVQNGLVTAIAAGTATVTVTTVDGNYTANCIIKVIQHVTKVEVNKSDISLKVGESEHLTATVSPANAENKNLVWSSSNNQVATVDANGNVQALKAGDAWIKAVSVDNTEAKDSCKVTVIQPVTGITISQPTIQFTNIGENIQLEATVLPEDASNKEVTWTSSNESVCMVANGMVVATGYGTAVVMAITKDGGFMASCSVIVEKETISVTGITLSQTSATLKKGETLQLEATVTPDDATNKTLIWKSSDETKCVVTQSGLLVALTEGQAIITVIPENGVGQAQCNVLIVDEGSSISTISVDASKSEMPIYDIMGQRVLHLMKGHLYICNGKKFIAK